MECVAVAHMLSLKSEEALREELANFPEVASARNRELRLAIALQAERRGDGPSPDAANLIAEGYELAALALAVEAHEGGRNDRAREMASVVADSEDDEISGDAKMVLGVVHIEAGEGAKGVQLLRQAAEKGSKSAADYLAKVLGGEMQVEGVHVDEGEARRMSEAAAEGLIFDSVAREYRRAMQDGDHEKARYWTLKGIRTGDFAFCAAGMDVPSIMRPEDTPKIKMALVDHALSGNPHAILCIASSMIAPKPEATFTHESGPALGFHMMEMLHNFGCRGAQFFIAMCKYHGVGTVRNRREAREIMFSALRSGEENARRALQGGAVPDRPDAVPDSMFARWKVSPE